MLTIRKIIEDQLNIEITSSFKITVLAQVPRGGTYKKRTSLLQIKGIKNGDQI